MTGDFTTAAILLVFMVGGALIVLASKVGK